MEDTAKYGNCVECGEHQPLDNQDKCSVCGTKKEN